MSVCRGGAHISCTPCFIDVLSSPLPISTSMIAACPCHRKYPPACVRHSPENPSKHTECSSCFTSHTLPSLKVHLTTSVSGLAPLTSSADLSAVQKWANEGSLMRCQTWLRCAGMREDSVTNVEVGMAVDILIEFAIWFLGN